jgi:hypothetical protein
VQLDKTRIGIRERGVLDTLDLSLQVLRAFIKPLLVTFALGAAPLMLLNHFLIGWMADVEYAEEFPVRYIWTMSLLVFIEAPLASVFATAYLGQAVFLERPSIRNVIAEVRQLLPRILWCQLVVRGIVPAWALLLSLERIDEVNVPVEVLLLPALAFYAAVLRTFRPFMNEIILLERNPLRGRDRTMMTIGRRSSLLHGPSSGDLLVRGFLLSPLSVVLVLVCYGVFLFVHGVSLNDWQQGPVMIQLFLPLSMWMVAGFFTVVRFLSYLDLRIRQEGWEVELRLRAEASRLTSKLT